MSLPHPAMLPISLALALALAQGSDEPRYPLGRGELPPMSEPATPFRLVDLRYRYEDSGNALSSLEARLRAGASSFLGGELAGERRAVFHDTTRTELGLTEENGNYAVEGGLRLNRFRTRVEAESSNDDWRVGVEGALRVNEDLELLASYREDTDRSRFDEGGALDAFVATGRLPPARPRTRGLESGAFGFYYQRESRLDVTAALSRARDRSEAGFDFVRDSLLVQMLLNRSALELSGGGRYERRRGRLAHTTGDVFVDAELRLLPRLVARAGTRHHWEPGVLRYEDSYRTGATFFARRHRFAREAETARRVEELTARAFALGYNERRVYDLDGLRALRERLGISSHREELAPLIDELYRAQVRERNVPLLSFEVLSIDDKRLGIDSTVYEIMAALPWWTEGDAVDFLQVTFRHREDDYSGIVRSVSRSLVAAAHLNREMLLRFGWEQPGLTPLDIILETSQPSRWTFALDYRLGR